MGVAGCFKNKSWGVWAAIPTACLARFAFTFISGVTVWAEYAPEGMPVALYSVLYNGGYIGAEMLLIFVVAFVLKAALPRILKAE